MDSMGKGFLLGIDNSGDQCAEEEFFNAAALRAIGARFVVKHYRPSHSVAEEARLARLFVRKAEENGIYVILNVEIGNWAETLVSPDGWDWVSREDGGHRFRFPAEVLEAFASSEAFAGVLYDEAEHAQMFRNLSIGLEGGTPDLSFFPDKPGLTLLETGEHIVECAKQLVGENLASGAPRVLCEYVWPSLMHPFAKAGMHIAFKQQKENWSNIWAACAIGAARQYGCELWACVDNWYRIDYPGHEPDEMAANLLFAYRAGIDRAYVENIGGESNFYTIQPDGSLELGKYGKLYRQFADTYLGGPERGYSHLDIEPDIAVVKYDDTFWGQGKGMPWRDMLFGSPEHRAAPESGEWIKAIHTVTHGTVRPDTLSWSRWDLTLGQPHRSFAPAKGLVVYDENAVYEQLKSARLIFLCGRYISEATLAAAGALVKEGATAVTAARFAPDGVRLPGEQGTAETADGNGRWIVTADMGCGEVKRLVADLIGAPDEITYRLRGGKTVRLRISPDGNTLEELQ